MNEETQKAQDYLFHIHEMLWAARAAEKRIRIQFSENRSDENYKLLNSCTFSITHLQRSLPEAEKKLLEAIAEEAKSNKDNPYYSVRPIWDEQDSKECESFKSPEEFLEEIKDWDEEEKQKAEKAIDLGSSLGNLMSECRLGILGDLKALVTYRYDREKPYRIYVVGMAYTDQKALEKVMDSIKRDNPKQVIFVNC